MEHGVAAKMGGNDFQLGENAENLPQTHRMRVIVALVAHVEHDGDLALDGVVHRIQPQIVNGKESYYILLKKISK